MSIRATIRTADPARALPPEALELDVDALLRRFAADPDPETTAAVPRSAPPRRRRLDLALAAVVVAIIAGVAIVPFSLPHDEPGSSTGTHASEAATRARAETLLDGIRLPSAATRTAPIPTAWLRRARVGLACKGSVSAQPRYWLIPGMTLPAVERYLQSHRPTGADRLPFDGGTPGDTTASFTIYRPIPASQVVIALARTPDGIGVRADAGVAPGGTCLAP